jgi:hypothetical protein
VNALKPPPPTDKKAAFWGAYMKLADEHDKEFKEKYSADLDTSLIFVRRPVTAIDCMLTPSSGGLVLRG